MNPVQVQSMIGYGPKTFMYPKTCAGFAAYGSSFPPRQEREIGTGRLADWRSRSRVDGWLGIPLGASDTRRGAPRSRNSKRDMSSSAMLHTGRVILGAPARVAVSSPPVPSSLTIRPPDCPIVVVESHRIVATDPFRNGAPSSIPADLTPRQAIAPGSHRRRRRG